MSDTDFIKRKILEDSPGPLIDRYAVAIGDDDIVPGRPFVAVAVAAGDLTYRPVGATEDRTETLAVGGFPNVANIPVLLEAVRSSSTVTSIVVGIF